jgi:DNA modification methylase
MIELYHAECLSKMQNIPDKSVDMICADLPYEVSNCSWDVIIPFKPLWEQYERIIKDNGAMVFTAIQPFTSLLVMSNPKLFRYSLVYQKNSPTGHLNAKKMPMRAHEDILVFYKKPPVYNPQKTFGHVRKVSSAVSRGKSIARNNLKDKVYNNEIIEKTPDYDSTERYPLSVLKFSTDKQRSKLHPTQKPVALMEYLIRTYTNEMDLVLDNCMGSGTTGVACVNTRRRFIGIEEKKEHFLNAQTRINNIYNE